MVQLSSHSLNNSTICWYKGKQTSALSHSYSLSHTHTLSSSGSESQKLKSTTGAEVSAESCWKRDGHDSGGWAWFLKPNVNTRFSCWAPQPLKSTYRHTHTQLTLAFEGPAGLSSGYSQSSAAQWWELQNAGFPSTFCWLHIINCLVFILAIQTNTWTVLRSAPKQKLAVRERAGWYVLAICSFKNIQYFTIR